ncbi:MAG: hypothetical protein SWQ30_04935 [Thermodesulfobacteriota bacterium]|nr:hypothetical protein [Thermodesulfobacteriota bacterium]
MQLLLNPELNIPMLQVIWLMSMNSVTLLLRKIKLALVTNYLFALFWGYSFMQEYAVDATGNPGFSPFLYFGAAAAVLFLALMGFLFQEEC